jgi:dynein heavy chain, axonemal
MIALKCIRSDKITEAIRCYICEKLGKQFIEPPTFNLGKSYKDSTVMMPLVFILSSGTNPVADFEKFAQEKNMFNKQRQVSLG